MCAELNRSRLGVLNRLLLLLLWLWLLIIGLVCIDGCCCWLFVTVVVVLLLLLFWLAWLVRECDDSDVSMLVAPGSGPFAGPMRFSCSISSLKQPTKKRNKKFRNYFLIRFKFFLILSFLSFSFNKPRYYKSLQICENNTYNEYNYHLVQTKRIIKKIKSFCLFVTKLNSIIE